MAIVRINTVVVARKQWSVEVIQRTQDWCLILVKPSCFLDYLGTIQRNTKRPEHFTARGNLSLGNWETHCAPGAMDSHLKNLWHMPLKAGRVSRLHCFLQNTYPRGPIVGVQSQHLSPGSWACCLVGQTEKKDSKGSGLHKRAVENSVTVQPVRVSSSFRIQLLEPTAWLLCTLLSHRDEFHWLSGMERGPCECWVSTLRSRYIPTFHFWCHLIIHMLMLTAEWYRRDM